MPIYEFRCESCGYVDEQLRSMGDETPGKCSKCSSLTRRIVSVPGYRIDHSVGYKNLG